MSTDSVDLNFVMRILDVVTSSTGTSPSPSSNSICRIFSPKVAMYWRRAANAVAIHNSRRYREVQQLLRGCIDGIPKNPIASLCQADCPQGARDDNSR